MSAELTNSTAGSVPKGTSIDSFPWIVVKNKCETAGRNKYVFSLNLLGSAVSTFKAGRQERAVGFNRLSPHPTCRCPNSRRHSLGLT